MTIQKSKYGITENSSSVATFILKNPNGMEVSIINYGGIITAIKTPDKKGVIENIVLGYDALQHYINDDFYLGAIIGPYANRIANGQFTLGGNRYALEKNDGSNTLHGGSKGLHKVLWSASTKTNKNEVSLVLNYLSKDMEEGFPGNLSITVTYTLHHNNVLDISYIANTDKKTVINLTNHSYFNLSGNFKDDILDHHLQIDADGMLPVNEFSIPTGKIITVKDTAFDFRTFKTIGRDIGENNQQLTLGSGYDHCFVLNNQNKDVRPIATAYHDKSGRVLEVCSDQPGLQLYSGNHLNGKHHKRRGFCLETQHYPDSPNQPHFPSVILQENQEYSSKTSYKFYVK